MRILTVLGIVVVAGGLLAQGGTPEGTSLTAGPAERIWSEPGPELWFRRSCKFDKPLRRASLVLSCDDQFELFVNGERMAAQNGWQKLMVVDVSEKLREGDNAIGVHAVDEGGSAALVVWLIWENVDGEKGEIVTDASWRAAGRPVEGWDSSGFDDSAWRAATTQGATPFGGNVYGMPPTDVVHVGVFQEATEGLDEALSELRAAPDVDAALEALDRLERALMSTRQALWEKKRQAEKDGKEAKRRDDSKPSVQGTQ